MSSSSTPSGVAIVIVSSSRFRPRSHTLNLDTFVRERSPLWGELETHVKAAAQGPDRLGPGGVRRLGTPLPQHGGRPRFRAARVSRRPVVERLEGSSRPSPSARLRGAFPPRLTPRRSSRTGYWRLLAERRVPLAARGRAALRAGAPRGRRGRFATRRRGGPRAGRISGVTDPRPAGQDLGLSPGEEARVLVRRSSRTTSASRCSLSPAESCSGLGHGRGADRQRRAAGRDRSGLAIGAGNGTAVLRAGHGARRARAVLHRRRGRRGAAARLGARRARTRTRAATRCGARPARPSQLVLGTAPWLVVAGLVEGFVTPAGIGLTSASRSSASRSRRVFWVARGRPRSAL